MIYQQIQRLNDFSCGLILHANDLNNIVNAINSIISALVELQDCCNNSNLQQDNSKSYSTILAFKGFASLDSALTEYSNIKTTEGIPNGWSNTSNINDDNLVLYMIQALKYGNEWVKDSLGTVWTGPYRIGASNKTEDTGVDRDGYNYIYHRTNDDPVILDNYLTINITWKLLMLNVESSSNKSYYNNGRTWTDHPQGVNENNEYEYIVGFKDDIKQFGPVIFSHYGLNGTDGDGLEYIFYLVGESIDENINPDIDNPSNYWKTTYTGHYKDDTGSIIIVNEGVQITDPKYQHDDFIPTGWHDEPQALDNVRNRQYVSIRKKQGNDREKEWGTFTEPKLWNNYATDGSKATLTNDTVFVDDDISSAALEIVSKTIPELWDGDTPISNFLVTVTNSGNVFDDYIEVCYLDNSDIKHTLAWEDNGSHANLVDINNVKNNTFYISKKSGVNNPFPEGSEQIIFTLSGSGKTATRVLTFLVKDFNDGKAYLLIVTPNTLGIEKESSGRRYLFRETPKLEISAVSTINGEEPVKLPLKTENDLTNRKDNLFIRIVDSSNNSIYDGSTISFNNDNTELTWSLPVNLEPMSDNVKHIQVDLYYYKEANNYIKIDSETVDFSITGDKGLDGNSTSTTYRVHSRNGNALIDDLTTDTGDLITATLWEIEVYKGTDSIIDKCIFNIVQSTKKLPDSLIIKTKDISGNLVDPNTSIQNYNYSRSGIFSLLPRNILNSLKQGCYSYEVEVLYFDNNEISEFNITNENYISIGKVKFNLTVSNISGNGEFYQLVILHDTLKYDFNNRKLSTYKPEVKVIKTHKGESTDQEYAKFKFVSSGTLFSKVVKFNNESKSVWFSYPLIPNEPKDGDFCVDFGILNNVNYSTKFGTSDNIIFDGQTSIPYSDNDYDITLYKYHKEDNNRWLEYIDVEQIHCVKNGGEGQRGSTGRMFYMLGNWSNQITYQVDNLKVPVVYYNGKYYYLNPDYTGKANGGIIPGGGDTFGNDYKSIWIEATDFGLIITEGIFGEFAKFGSGIISGDFMFSINGRVHEIRRKDDNANSTENIWVSIPLSQDSSMGKSYFDSTNHYNYKYYGNNSLINVPAYTLFKTNDLFADKVTENNDPHFTPNWWVDLRTGEQGAAKGNFIINKDGTVTIGGNTTHDITINNAVIKHSLFYYNKKDSGSDMTLNDVNTGYIYKTTADISGSKYEQYYYSLEKCTMLYDLIYIATNINRPTESGNYHINIVLPPAYLFEGQQLVITNNSNNFVSTDKIYLTVIYTNNDDLGHPVSLTGPQVTGDNNKVYYQTNTQNWEGWIDGKPYFYSGGEPISASGFLDRTNNINNITDEIVINDYDWLELTSIKPDNLPSGVTNKYHGYWMLTRWQYKNN